MVPVVFLLLACGTGTVVPVSDSGPAPDTDEPTGSVEDTAPEVDQEPPVTVDVIGEHELDDSWIFSHEVIHEIEIVLSEASVAALGSDPYSYVEGSVSIDGELIDPVGVRLRGKIGSFRELDGKPKFKLDFNRFVDGRRFQDMEALSLNNSVVDCSYLKEPIGYHLFEAAGVPASRTGFATVTVNGSPYGLYVLVEVPDDRFLRRHYLDPSGRLYDGKYVWYGGYSYQLLDFGDGVDTMYQLEEGEDIAHADIIAVSETLAAAWGQATFEADMATVLNWDRHHRMWAVEQWIGQNDGYTLNTNNYRVYFDPLDGLADLVPWDLDYAFLYDSEWGLSWWSPRGNLTYGCLQDASCVATHVEVVAEVLDAVVAAEPLARFDQLVELIDEAAAADPRRECSADSVASTQAYVRGWIEGQDAVMRSAWGL